MLSTTQREQRFIDRLKGYLGSKEPVSFFDIVLALEDIKHLPFLPDPVLDGLVQLHDSPQITLGAQESLAEFLQAQVLQQTAERQNAMRVLRMVDQGTRVRLGVSTPLTIELPSRKALGCRWQNINKRLNAKLEISEANDSTSFIINFNKPGTIELLFKEDGPAHHKNEDLKEFSLTVLIEEN